MWKSFYLGTEVFFLKFISSESHKLYLSNLHNVWLEELSEDDVKQRFHELNPLYVDANIIEELTNLIKNASTDTATLTGDDSSKRLEINIVIDKFPLKFYWELYLETADTLFKILTLNLINTIQYLELEQRGLCELLEKKDKEINEYKREYGEISRDLLKTERFIRKEAMDDDTKDLLLDMLTNKDVFPQLMNKYGSEVIKKKSKSVEKVEVKRKRLKPYKSKTVM